MLDIPEEIKELFRADNLTDATVKKLEINFFDKDIEILYPYETLYPDDIVFPADLGTPWLSIKNDRIVSKSFKLSESLCSTEDLTFGSCEAAQMEFVCADIEENIEGKEFLATMTVGNYVLMLGTYTVSSAKRQADRRLKKVVAYDRMIRFDTDVSVWYSEFFSDGNRHTLYEFRCALCDYVGVSQESVSLVNDDMVVKKTIDAEQLSGREVLRAICEINGVFGHIARTGELKYVTIKNTGLYPSETLYPAEELYPSEAQELVPVGHYRSALYEEYIVNEIDRLTIRQDEGTIGTIVGSGNNGYIVEGNFLVYGKTALELDSIAGNLYMNISGRFYRPHKTVATGLPYVEVGDGLLVATSNDLIETFIFSRVLSGIQALKDEYSATGNEYREEVFGVTKEIIQLKGKTSVIKKQVDEVSVELKDFETETTANLKVTADQIAAEVERATGSEGELAAAIKVNADNISLKVSKGDVSSQISVESGGVDIRGDRFSWQSTNSSMSADGTLNCKNAIIRGKVTAETGEFGLFKISSNGIKASSSATTIEFGDNFYVSGDGACIGSVTIGNDGIDLGVLSGKGYAGTWDSSGVIKCTEIYVADSWWDGWSLTKTIKRLWEDVEELQNYINNEG